MLDPCLHQQVDLFESGQFVSNTSILTLAFARDPNIIIDDVCCVCMKPIPEGQEIEIQDRKFHFDCFSCDLCRRKFGKDQYLVHDKYVLHEFCFKVVSSPRCYVCGGILAESKIIEGCGHLYHSQCFKCIKCKKEIKTNQVYYKPNGLQVCSTCIHHSHKICLHCDQETDDNCLRFLYQGHTYYYHNDCAHCSVCNCNLTSENFHYIFGHGICRICWYKAMKHQCKKCGLPILPSDLVITQGEWHYKCFRCTMCGQFVPFSIDVLIDGNCIYCTNCRKCIKTHCAVCKKFIEKNGVEKNGKVVHLKCLNCIKCGKLMAKTDDCVLIGDKVYCFKCVPNNMQ